MSTENQTNEVNSETKSPFIFNDNGSINWRSMVKAEYLYPNREWFETRNLPVPDSIEGLADNQLLIKLGGLKELAKLRGYNSVKYKLIKCDPDYVITKCSIEWKPLIFNNQIQEDACHFEDVANASLDNTNDFCSKFLETIAANRSFVRCVRNYLGINIVGDEEIDKSKNKFNKEKSNITFDGDLTPQGLLKQQFHKKLGIEDFEGFKNHLRTLWVNGKYQNEKVVDWTCFKDVPAKECRALISIISQ
jgi:hypothetical protein